MGKDCDRPKQHRKRDHGPRRRWGAGGVAVVVSVGRGVVVVGFVARVVVSRLGVGIVMRMMGGLCGDEQITTILRPAGNGGRRIGRQSGTEADQSQRGIGRNRRVV